MKVLFSILSFLSLFLSASAQNIILRVNPQTINAQLNQKHSYGLNEQGGYVIIPKSMISNVKSPGIILYHHNFDDVYYAYDRLCPECASKHKLSLVTMQCRDIIECKTCGSEFMNISFGSPQQTNHSGTHYLKTYVVDERNNQLIVRKIPPLQDF